MTDVLAVGCWTDWAVLVAAPNAAAAVRIWKMDGELRTISER